MLPFHLCTSRLILATIAVTIGGSLQIGFNLSCMNAPAKHIITWTVHVLEHGKDYVNCAPPNNTMNVKKDPCHQQKSPKEHTIYYSILVSVYVLGAMFGSLFSHAIADYFGPKRALLYNNALGYIGTTLMCFSYYLGFTGYFTFLIGRLTVGFSSGIISGTVPSYLTDITSYRIRGLVCGFYMPVLTFGLFLGGFIGIFLGECDRWNTIFIFSYIPITVSLVALPFCPESRRHRLKVEKQKMKREREKKKRISPGPIASLSSTSTALPMHISFFQMLKRPYRWPLLLGVALAVGQQFSGISAVVYYSTNIFEKDAGLGDKDAKWATAGLMLFNVLCSAFAVWLGHRPWVGRRRMVLTGLSGCCYVMLLLFILLKLLDCTIPDFPRKPTNYFAIGLLILYILFFNGGPKMVMWSFVSESFHSAARLKANSIVACANWFCNFLLGLIFNSIRETIGVYAFLIFVVLGSALILFLFLFLPETKGKAVEHLEKEMRTGTIVAFKTGIRKRRPPTSAELAEHGVEDSLDSMRFALSL